MIMKNKHKKKNKNIWIWTLAILVIWVFVYFVYSDKPSSNSVENPYESEIISRNGIHWHPELSIYIKGEKVEIPANIGLGAVHNPIHTHDEDAQLGVIHLEFSSVVRGRDTKLSEFFKIWNKDINSFGSNIRMTVNGSDNLDFGNYYMKDKDKIELYYE